MHDGIWVFVGPLEKWLPNSYILNMGHHSVVEAKNQLSDLIDRALKGEAVVITRHGRPVVEITPVSRRAKPISRESMDWLAQRRASRPSVDVDSGTLMSKLRDEWKR